jgi:hypothetical protein
VLAQDSNGCGNGKVYFDPPPHRSVGAPVPGITLRLCEWDADGGTRLYCTSHYFDNWRVP